MNMVCWFNWFNLCF